MVGIEVRHENVGHPRIFTQVDQQFPECFKPSGGGADSGDGK